MGTQGPDQGYVYKLVGLFDDKLQLGRVSHDDAVAGCSAIAMRRSALFGRGPIVHDLTIAFTIWGFLDPRPDGRLVQLREEKFSQIKSNHHYVERREVVDLVKESALMMSKDEVSNAYAAGWRDNLNV